MTKPCLVFLGQLVKVTFWSNGFTVEDGPDAEAPLRAMEDPRNAAFLAAVSRGYGFNARRSPTFPPLPPTGDRAIAPGSCHRNCDTTGTTSTWSCWINEANLTCPQSPS